MQTIERRIAALEQARPASSTGPIYVRFVAGRVADIDKPIEKIWGCGGDWFLQSGESDSEFKARALSESKPNPHGAQIFLCA